MRLWNNPLSDKATIELRIPYQRPIRFLPETDYPRNGLSHVPKDRRLGERDRGVNSRAELVPTPLDRGETKLCTFKTQNLSESKKE